MKIGHVTLQEWEPGRWKIRYCDPATSKDFRMRLDAATLAEAVADAEAHNRYCRGDIDTPPHLQIKRRKVAAGLTIKEAMAKSEAELRGGKDSLRNYRTSAARFDAYANIYNVTCWRQVTRELIRQYYRDMVGAGLAHDTIRLNLIPLRVTSRYWALESDEFKDVYMAARIKHRRPDGWEPEIQHLTLEQVRALLAWIKKNAPARFYAMAMIGIHTGARQLEIAGLRLADIDRKRNVLTITDTETHDVKTASSKREVPVPAAVIDAITEWPVEANAPLFVTVGGSSYDANKLAKEWRRFVLVPGRTDTKLNLPEWFTAKKMRPTFATLAGETGVEEVYLQKMLGHSPDNTMRKFYRNIDANILAKTLARYWQLLQNNKRKTSNINAA